LERIRNERAVKHGGEMGPRWGGLIKKEKNSPLPREEWGPRHLGGTIWSWGTLIKEKKKTEGEKKTSE